MSSDKDFVNPVLAEQLRPVPRLLSLGVAFAALLALLLKSASPVTAIGLLLAAYASLSRSRATSVSLGVVLIAFSAVRPLVPITALAFELFGWALICLRLRSSQSNSLAHFLAFGLAVVATLPLVGHLYGAKFVTGIGVLSGMAPQTALCFILLSMTIFLGRLDHDLAALLISDGPGGFMTRRILPAAIIFPCALGFLKVAGQRAGLFSEELGSAFVVTITIAGFSAFIWYQGLVLQRGESRRRHLARERELLTLQEQARDQFISMISHDLRTPLAAASAYAQLMRRFPEKHESAPVYADKILESLSRSDRMIQDLLDIGRVRAGHPLPIAPAECDLRLILTTTLQELSAVHGDRFNLSLPDSTTDLHGIWDPRAIRRAIENLCNNAIKYGARGTRVTVAVERPDVNFVITVHNYGPAIAPEQQGRLFVAFERGEARERGAGGVRGWGIGLALVRAIAEAHGGRVHLESSAVNGTSFILELLPSPRGLAGLSRGPAA